MQKEKRSSWNKGLTKENDPRMAKASASNKGRIPWNKNKKLPYNPKYSKAQFKRFEKNEEREKLSKAHIGKKPNRIYLPLSKEHIKKLNMGREKMLKEKGHPRKIYNGTETKKCIECKKEIKIKRYNKRYEPHWKDRIFCSRKCANIKNQKNPAVLEKKLSYISKKKNTLPEIIMENWLNEQGYIENIHYKKQHAIESRSKVDFFIYPNIALYVDGDYYHNLGDRKERDEKINRELQGKGYLVYRIFESDIKKGIRPIVLKR